MSSGVTIFGIFHWRKFGSGCRFIVLVHVRGMAGFSGEENRYQQIRTFDRTRISVPRLHGIEGSPLPPHPYYSWRLIYEWVFPSSRRVSNENSECTPTYWVQSNGLLNPSQLLSGRSSELRCALKEINKHTYDEFIQQHQTARVETHDGHIRFTGHSILLKFATLSRKWNDPNSSFRKKKNPKYLSDVQCVCLFFVSFIWIKLLIFLRNLLNCFFKTNCWNSSLV